MVVDSSTGGSAVGLEPYYFLVARFCTWRRKNALPHKRKYPAAAGPIVYRIGTA